LEATEDEEEDGVGSDRVETAIGVEVIFRGDVDAEVVVDDVVVDVDDDDDETMARECRGETIRGDIRGDEEEDEEGDDKGMIVWFDEDDEE